MNGSVSQSKPTLSRFLRMAIVAGVESAVRIHIERGDNLNARDAGGQTPLMLAAARSKPHICKLLSDAGADPLLSDPGGSNALFIANGVGVHEVASLLEPAFASILQTASADNAYRFNDPPANDDVICISESIQDATLAPDPPVSDVADIAPPPLPEIAESDVTLDPPALDHKNDIGFPAAPIPNFVDLIDFDEDGATLVLSGWPHMGDASEDMREEFDFMAEARLTPEQYGLKVKSSEVLMITSPLEMRNSQTLSLKCSGTRPQTIRFHRDSSIQVGNLAAAYALLSYIGEDMRLTQRSLHYKQVGFCYQISSFLRTLYERQSPI